MFIYTTTYIWSYIFNFTNIHISIHTLIHTHTHLYIYIYIHNISMYIHTYIHTHYSVLLLTSLLLACSVVALSRRVTHYCEVKDFSQLKTLLCMWYWWNINFFKILKLGSSYRIMKKTRWILSQQLPVYKGKYRCDISNCI